MLGAAEPVWGSGSSATNPGIWPRPERLAFGTTATGAIPGFADPDAGVGFGFDATGRETGATREHALIDAVIQVSDGAHLRAIVLVPIYRYTSKLSETTRGLHMADLKDPGYWDTAILRAAGRLMMLAAPESAPVTGYGSHSGCGRCAATGSVAGDDYPAIHELEAEGLIACEGRRSRADGHAGCAT